MNIYRIEMRNAEHVLRFCNVVAGTAATAETVACYYNAGYRAIWISLLEAFNSDWSVRQNISIRS
jgi:hypothetical protein